MLTILGATGCKQQLYMHQDDHLGVTTLNLPKDLDTNPNYSVAANPREDIRTPPTVDDPDQPARYMTLQEALIMGLEQGNRGNNSAAALPGGNISRSIVNDDLVTFTGSGVSSDDPIRAFALDPASIGANIEGALAKFDTRWVTAANWGRTDTAPVNIFSAANNGDTASVSSGFIKPLPTGGVAGVTFETDYQKVANPNVGGTTYTTTNPAYRPSLTFAIDQPLLRDYGVDINQLLASHPGSSVIPNYKPTGGRSEGILITRIRYEQQKYEFERNVNILLFNIESAYWNLYASYYALYANDQGLRQSFETWRLTRVLVEAGLRADQDLAQVRSRFEGFRASRIAALQTTMEAERQLRSLLGMPPVDGFRLVPADQPTQALYMPDYKEAVNETLQNRPELNMIRQDLKAQQLNLLVQKNSTRPDLRFSANYNINSIGSRLDGSAPNNALGALADNNYNTWNMGLRLDIPLGYRDGYAAKRVAELQLARTYVTLRNQERKAEDFTKVAYQQLFNQYQQIRAYRAQREALGRELELLFSRVQLGKDPLLNMLDAQRDFASAIQSEQQAVANYNVAIAGFHYAKGTLQMYDNVGIADGPLPSSGLIPSHEVHKRKRRFDKTGVEPVASGSVVPGTPVPGGVLPPGVVAPAVPAPVVPGAPLNPGTPAPTTPGNNPPTAFVPGVTSDSASSTIYKPTATQTVPSVGVPLQPSVLGTNDVAPPNVIAPPPITSDTGRPLITVTTTPNENVPVPPAGALLPPANDPVPGNNNFIPTSRQK